MEGKDRLMYIYGVNPVIEAFRFKEALQELYIAKNRLPKLKELIKLAEKHSVSVKVVDEDFINKRVEGNHQGVMAKIKQKKTITVYDAIRISEERKEPAFFLILDLIEDPQNFGAILRVADAAGVHAVIYQERRSAGIVPSVWKSSAGAVWHVNLVEINNIKYAIKELKNVGISVYALEASGERILWECNFIQPLAFVVGSEGKGIRQTVLSICDEVVKIPMKGMLNSLNVSVAAGVLAFEVLKQRHNCV